MKYFPTLCALAALALTMTACQAGNHDADAKVIQDNEVQWNQDLVSKDVDKLMSHYADDAVLMGPGMPPSSGKDAIRTVMKEMVSDPAMSLKFRASKIEVANSGDIAYTRGSYTMTMTDPQTNQVVNDHGSFLTTYRKQADGTWKAVSDIASSELPLSVPSAMPAMTK